MEVVEKLDPLAEVRFVGPRLDGSVIWHALELLTNSLVC